MSPPLGEALALLLRVVQLVGLHEWGADGCSVMELAPALCPAPACGPGWKNAAVPVAFLAEPVASGPAVAWFLPSSGPAPSHWRGQQERTPCHLLPPCFGLDSVW